MITILKKSEAEEFVSNFKKQFKTLFEVDVTVSYDLSLKKKDIKKLLNATNELLQETCPNMYPEGIRCKLRHQTLSEHRQVFFMMAREMGYSYSYLSKFLDYNHATVIHSYNKVMDMLKIQDKVMTDIYQGIKCKLYDNEPIQDTGGESDLPKSDLSAL